MAQTDEVQSLPPKAQKKTQISQTPEQSPRTSHNKLSTVALVIAMVSLGAVSYVTYKAHHKIDYLQSTVDQLIGQQLDDKKRFSDTLKSIGNTQDAMVTQISSITNTLNTALQQQFYQNHDWRLLQARYYLELAQINSKWTYNIQTTKSLLTQAHQALEHNPEPNLTDIRETLQHQIDAIDSIPILNNTALLEQLNALDALIDQLPFKPIQAILRSTENSSTINAMEPYWRQQWNKSLNMLSQLVVVQHHNETMQPLLLESEKHLLIQNLHLSFKEVQWAVLQYNDAEYHLVLKEIGAEIDKFLDTNSPTTQSFLKKLDELQDISLLQDKPNLDGILEKLDEFLNARNHPIPPVEKLQEHTP